MRMLFVVLLMLLAGPVGAQCFATGTTGNPPFPTQVTFAPAQPAAATPIVANLGPATNAMPNNLAVTRTGNVIVVTASLGVFGGVPPPPMVLPVNLGAFPAGNYTVRFRLTDGDNNDVACAPLDVPLVVGGGAPVVELPALGLPMTLVLLLSLCFVVALALRSRADRV
jgi:hypothetical protein